MQSEEPRDYLFEDRNHPFFKSYNYEALIISKYGSMDLGSLMFYLCGIGDPDNESTSFLSSSDDSVIYVRNVPAHDVIFSGEENKCVCTGKYRSGFFALLTEKRLSNMMLC